MFSSGNPTKSTLLCGPKDLTKNFMFEAAIFWAEQGHRVIYITTFPLDALPAVYHDRNQHSPAAFKLMRFIYIEDYEMLVEQLADLPTFEFVPSVLLIDDLDAYVECPEPEAEAQEIPVARLCAIIQDTADACSRITKNPIRLCVATASDEPQALGLFFADSWRVRALDDGENMEIRKTCGKAAQEQKIFCFAKFQDGCLALKKILAIFGDAAQ